MLLVESSNHALDQIFSDLNRMRFGCMHDVGKWWIFFPFIPPLFSPVVFLIFCWLEWLRVWTYLFIQVSAIHYIQIVETDMTSLLCVAEALEALVLIVGGRGTEHQNAQTMKIFSSFFNVGIFLGL